LPQAVQSLLNKNENQIINFSRHLSTGPYRFHTLVKIPTTFFCEGKEAVHLLLTSHKQKWLWCYYRQYLEEFVRSLWL